MADDLGPDDLGIDVARSDQQLFRWFLASLLFGRNIRQQQAARTYSVLIDHGLTSPARFADLEHEELSRLLDEGGYDRFDDQMADELQRVMSGVHDDWGSVHRLVATAADRAVAERRMTAYKGVGPTTARIFLDEVPAGVYASA
ncbi:hypothetical protein [Amnibacterium endophyticum]|uniref:DNA methylase n=1 Tax=Amnibacterium endophyticum TaxID=2109337 RepID=A0ABW4LDN0_9MICO